MHSDDVRARFEAWAQREQYALSRLPTGAYADYDTQNAWFGYRAAHADLSGEVRGLVEGLKAAQWDCHGKCPVCAGFMVGPNGETRHAHTPSCPVGIALAKFTQEKP